MSKELVISANRHETKVAILEDDQLVEVFFQRANEYSFAGSIHKGRVTRVLPGMQSAFVDLGLERDTFLYVSDFFEENEEFDRVSVNTGSPSQTRTARPPERVRRSRTTPARGSEPRLVPAVVESDSVRCTALGFRVRAGPAYRAVQRKADRCATGEAGGLAAADGTADVASRFQVRFRGSAPVLDQSKRPRPLP